MKDMTKCVVKDMVGDTMKGIVAASPGCLEVKDDIPMPELKDYECLCRIHTCGFCNGTDVQIINGTITEEEGLMPYPTVLGHEAVGEVISIGNKVRHIKLGDRFLRPDSRKWYGKYSCTYGVMAEYAFATDRQAMIEDGVPAEMMPDEGGALEGKCRKIPNDISYEDEAVMLSLLECLTAVHNCGIRHGDRVLIYGAGPMGLGVSAYLKIIGAEVVITDNVKSRLQIASEKLGVDRVVNFDIEKLSDVCEKKSFDYVMDIVGSTKILMEGSAYLKQGGTLFSMGVLKKTDSVLEVTKLQNNTKLHMHNFPYRRMDHIDELVDLIHSGKINPKDFYSHVIKPEEVCKGIELLRKKEALKLVVSFE